MANQPDVEVAVNVSRLPDAGADGSRGDGSGPGEPRPGAPGPGEPRPAAPGPGEPKAGAPGPAPTAGGGSLPRGDGALPGAGGTVPGGSAEDAAIEGLCRRVAAAAVVKAAPPGRWFVDITLTGDGVMRSLNREYRGMDETTDVLSFPQFDGGELETAAEGGEGGGGPLPLGDVIVNLEEARRAARRYGHSFRREVGFLTAHGILHLLGFTHEGPEDEAVMAGLTEEILAALGLHR